MSKIFQRHHVQNQTLNFFLKTCFWGIFPLSVNSNTTIHHSNHSTKNLHNDQPLFSLPPTSPIWSSACLFLALSSILISSTFTQLQPYPLGQAAISPRASAVVSRLDSAFTLSLPLFSIRFQPNSHHDLFKMYF